MAVIHARQALLPEGWRTDVRLVIRDGVIAELQTGVAPEDGDEQHGYIVAGMANLHSHAFQRAMAGLAEIRGPGDDSFWTWRDVMYRMALSMDPDDVEVVAAQLYVEMLEAGFTRVGEFHYLHHDKDGNPYSDRAEMAVRIAAASSETGIGLTLLPVLYAHSGFGGLPPGEGQRRFINGIDGFGQIFERCGQLAAVLAEGRVGIAPHSLRAVTLNELSAAVAMAGNRPIHIHIAEQIKEVEDCIAWSGSRPVEFLLENQSPDQRWCLIHATHMTPKETVAFAATGAVAGLCPITEANLGDGVFPAADFAAAGGAYGIGTDSNIMIGVCDELRQLEYSQRLFHRSRNVMTKPGISTGRGLFDAATNGGARALGVASGLAIGNSADMVSLKPDFGQRPKADFMLDSWIFANGVKVDCVWVHGSRQVENGAHRHRQRVAERFAACMKKLSVL